MESVRGAGFKTDGPPAWLWRTQKASVLNALRELKPKSGLSITEVALERYKAIDEREKKKAEIKKQYQKAKKVAKKTKIACDPETEDRLPEKGYVDASDYPPTNFKWEFVVPKFESWPCFICDGPVVFYEKLEPVPICMWCEKETENKA